MAGLNLERCRAFIIETETAITSNFKIPRFATFEIIILP